MNFKIRELKISGAFEIEFDRHLDQRGWFSRVYDSKIFNEIGMPEPAWKQQNESFTAELGAVRGMHFQMDPFPEVKYVRCTAGEILDIILDVREGSATYGTAEAIQLSDDSSKAVLVPSHCAHGFQALKPNSKIQYLVSSVYSPEFEAGYSIRSKATFELLPLPVTQISARDEILPYFDKGSH